MSDVNLYNLLRVFSVGLLIAQTVLVQAASTFAADLSLTRAAVAVMSLTANAIGVALLYMPQLNKAAGNTRGDSSDN